MQRFHQILVAKNDEPHQLEPGTVQFSRKLFFQFLRFFKVFFGHFQKIPQNICTLAS